MYLKCFEIENFLPWCYVCKWENPNFVVWQDSHIQPATLICISCHQSQMGEGRQRVLFAMQMISSLHLTVLSPLTYLKRVSSNAAQSSSWFTMATILWLAEVTSLCTTTPDIFLLIVLNIWYRQDKVKLKSLVAPLWSCAVFHQPPQSAVTLAVHEATPTCYMYNPAIPGHSTESVLHMQTSSFHICEQFLVLQSNTSGPHRRNSHTPHSGHELSYHISGSLWALLMLQTLKMTWSASMSVFICSAFVSCVSCIFVLHSLMSHFFPIWNNISLGEVWSWCDKTELEW